MKTASVRDIRLNFPRVMAWIADGEQVKITMRRKVIARLVPETETKPGKIMLPDFAANRRRHFGDQTFSDNNSMVEQEREDYRW